MPIQFPKPSGPIRSYIESQWWKQHTKAFDCVPAPNMGSIGQPLSFSSALGKPGWSLDPGIGIASAKAVNLRRLGTMYQAPNQTAIVNPMAARDEVYDNTGSFDRVLGEQNERITGVSRDATGAALGNVTVKVFQTISDTLVGSTVSDGSGNWTVLPNMIGPYYFVEYKAGSPDVFGTSPNTNGSTQFAPGG